MNREQAKAVVELGLDKLNMLKEIGYQNIDGLEKHWELVKAFGDGAVIQRDYTGGWCDMEHARFLTKCEYRIKPDTFKIGNEEFEKPNASEVMETQTMVYALEPISTVGYYRYIPADLEPKAASRLINRSSLFLSEADAKRAVKVLGWEIE